MPITIDKRVKKKNGVSRYRVKVNYVDANGSSRQVERLVWGKAEAVEMEMRLREDYANKRVGLAPRITVGELYDKYVVYHAIETRQSTHENVKRRLRLWVLPYFKDKYLDRITQEDFVSWKVKISAESIKVSTKQSIFKAFVALLNYAVKMNYIQKNGLAALGNFKDNTALVKPVESLHYYTASQFEQFISAARADCKTLMDWDFYVFFCVAFFTGARKGEIHALRWSDLEGNVLHIRRSIAQKLKGGDVETAPKNTSSIRDLQLPKPLLAVLSKHKQRQQELAKKLFNENKYICGFDKPLRDTTIDIRNRKYAEAAGLPRIKIHDFRHSHVSLLANEGINIQEVARRLGHSNVQETWNTYCHLYPREEERAVEVLNRIGTGE